MIARWQQAFFHLACAGKHTWRAVKAFPLLLVIVVILFFLAGCKTSNNAVGAMPLVGQTGAATDAHRAHVAQAMQAAAASIHAVWQDETLPEPLAGEIGVAAAYLPLPLPEHTALAKQRIATMDKAGWITEKQTAAEHLKKITDLENQANAEKSAWIKERADLIAYAKNAETALKNARQEAQDGLLKWQVKMLSWVGVGALVIGLGLALIPEPLRQPRIGITVGAIGLALLATSRGLATIPVWFFTALTIALIITTIAAMVWAYFKGQKNHA